MKALLWATLASACAPAGPPPPAAPPPPPPAEPVMPATPSDAAAAEPEEVAAPPQIEKADYGTVGDKKVDLYTLRNANGLVLKVTNYGTIITELHVPDRDGKLSDIVLGFDSLDGYLKSSPYFGATVGRVANRIKNAKFTLEGKQYKLAANDKPHSLHGGEKGWDKVVWTAEPKESPSGPAVKFTYVSPDGEEGYPGTVTASTTYTLTNNNELRVDMQATTDKTTIVNMAHHSYFNLGGHNSGTIKDHKLTLFASSYTPSVGLVPTGQVKKVKGTPFDFTTGKPIGKDLKAAGGKPIGFDHNWVVDGNANELRKVARVEDPKSGRVMTIEANQPGVQFYSGNFLDGTIKGKGDTMYQQYTGFCLETQKFPNSINIPAWKDSVILKPGDTYKHTMIYKFTTEPAEAKPTDAKPSEAKPTDAKPSGAKPTDAKPSEAKPTDAKPASPAAK